MIHRRAAELVTEALAHSPAVALLGPRQVGKTTLASAAAAAPGSVYLDLERAADVARLADAYAFLDSPGGPARRGRRDQAQRAFWLAGRISQRMPRHQCSPSFRRVSWT